MAAVRVGGGDDLAAGVVPAAAPPVDPVQALIAQAVAAGGNIDALIATAAGGGDAFAGVPGAPAVDFTLPTAEIGTGSFLGSVAFDTGAGQIQNLENTTTFAASKANTTTTTTVAPPPDLVASAPNLNTATPATGNEDKPIALNISAAVTDLDGSESITSITISGVPAGAVLSAGTNNGNGTWTLTPAQLTGLTITPPANSDADFTLTVTATATESASGATATSSSILSVVVNAVADAPTVTVTNVTGNEDTAISLNIATALTDSSESITNVTISGVPVGATLPAG